MQKSSKFKLSEKSLEPILANEALDTEKINELVSSGRAAVAHNGKRPKPLSKPCIIGAGCKTKVNANIGTSTGIKDIEEELLKLSVCEDAGADTVMDLSTGGDLDEVRRIVLEHANIPVGTVPIYQAAVESISKYGSIVDLEIDFLFDVIEKHAADGVDFMTVHCGMTREALSSLNSKPRLTDIVSRGGAFLAGWMLHNDKENPLYEHFDRLLEIAKKYGVILSLGDAMRPGSLADSGDPAQHSELYTIGKLVAACREQGVQAIVEGPGHVPLHKVVESVQVAKSLTDNAPLYLLGPLVTDIGAGYDHITGAIGGAVAAMAGADYLCYVTPKEHLGLPTPEDVREGVIASKIAAHAADIAKGIPGARDIDDQMSEARKNLDWQTQLKLCLDPQKAYRFFNERTEKSIAGCTMCGELCAMEFVGGYLNDGEASPASTC